MASLLLLRILLPDSLMWVLAVALIALLLWVPTLPETVFIWAFLIVVSVVWLASLNGSKDRR
jgi:hypothetical protein